MSDHPLGGPSTSPSLTTEELLEAQKHALQAQDRALDQLHVNILEVQGVSRAIGEEAGLQSALLEDMHDDAESGTRAVERGQDTLVLVESRSDTRSLHSLICALGLVFIVLLLFKIG